MRSRSMLLPTLFTCLIVSAAFAGKAAVERYGAPVTVAKPTDLAAVAKDPAAFEGQTLRLEGKVAKSCQARGCWIEVAGPKGATFMAKSLDESVLVPKNIKSRRVVVQGVIVALPASGHDHGEDGEAAHECPAPSYVLSTQGVELAKK